MFGEAARDVRVLGGVTYTQGTLTRTAGGAFDGNDAIAVPRVQATLGVDWDNSLAPGLGLNARVVYTGQQYADQRQPPEDAVVDALRPGRALPHQARRQPSRAARQRREPVRQGLLGVLERGLSLLGASRTVMLSATMDFERQPARAPGANMSTRAWFLIHKWTSLDLHGLPAAVLPDRPAADLSRRDRPSGWRARGVVLPAGTPDASLDRVADSARAHRPDKVLRYMFWDAEEHPNLTLVSMAGSMDAPPDDAWYMALTCAPPR